MIQNCKALPDRLLHQRDRNLYNPESLPTTVRHTADDSLILSNSYITSDFNTTKLTEESRHLSYPYGEGDMRHWYFDGIRLGHSRWKYNQEFSSAWKNDLDVVHLHFNLRGRTTIRHSAFDKEIVFRSYEHNMMYSNGFEGIIQHHELDSETFMIQFTKEAFLKLTQNTDESLEHFGKEILKGEPVLFSGQNLSIGLDLHHAIRSVIDCHLPPGLKKLFLFSRCLEILALQAQAFHKAQGESLQYARTDYDKERLLFARDYLIDHMDIPPSLSDLARRAGINEFKLKRGFKEMFGNTVFGYLADYRLELARNYLTAGQKTASEIAFELGYSSLQHFSMAFKKKYGVSPRELG